MDTVACLTLCGSDLPANLEAFVRRLVESCVSTVDFGSLSFCCCSIYDYFWVLICCFWYPECPRFHERRGQGSDARESHWDSSCYLLTGRRADKLIPLCTDLFYQLGYLRPAVKDCLSRP